MTDAIESDSKREIQKTAEATVDLIGNKIADKTTIFQNLQRNFIHKIIRKNCIQKQMNMKQKCQKKDIYVPRKGNKLLMN